MECYSAVQKNKIMQLSGRIEPGKIRLSEVTHTQIDKCFMLSFIGFLAPDPQIWVHNTE